MTLPFPKWNMRTERKGWVWALLIILFSCFLLGFYFSDRGSFICPIDFSGKAMVIRNDNRGDGLFSASRSGRRLHNGIDLSAPLGTPVLAARAGKVLAAARNKGMGRYVIIRHSGNIVSIYGHLSAVDVKKGQKVRQGEVIGRVGKTGNSNYRDILPHLHFELRKQGIPQDPLGYIK